MKITVSKKRLEAAIKSVAPAASSRATLPILGIRIDATKRGLVLEATDLEVAARRTLSGDIRVERPGTLVTPAKGLAKAVRSMEADQVVLEREGAEVKPRLIIAAGGRRVALDSFPSEDFPRSQDDSRFDVKFRVEASVLSEALMRAAICASRDEARPALTTVALFARQKSRDLEVVATDSYRLGALRVPLRSPAASDSTLLVPARAAQLLAKDLRKERGEVAIGIDQREDDPAMGSAAVRFAFGSSAWTMRLVEGDFPNWRELLPSQDAGASLDLDSTELASALKAVRSVASGRGTPVRLRLGGVCSVALAEQDSGSMEETLSNASYAPDGVGDLEVAFNPEYLADALRFCADERVHVAVRDGLKPALFGTPAVRYLLMPVRIS